MGRPAKPRPLPDHCRVPEKELVQEGSSISERLRAILRNENAWFKHTEQWVEVYRGIYEGEGLRLAAWQAYQLVRALHKPLPRWILEYLDRCADNLLSDRNRMEDVGRCLELDANCAKPFVEYDSLLRRKAGKQWVLTYINEGNTVTRACERAAETINAMWSGEEDPNLCKEDVRHPKRLYPVNQATVKDWYYNKNLKV